MVRMNQSIGNSRRIASFKCERFIIVGTVTALVGLSGRQVLETQTRECSLVVIYVGR